MGRLQTTGELIKKVCRIMQTPSCSFGGMCRALPTNYMSMQVINTMPCKLASVVKIYRGLLLMLARVFQKMTFVS